MKVVQTRLNDGDYLLLKEMALKSHRSIKDIAREALLTYIKKTEVDPEDSMFSAPVAKEGARNGSTAHDRYLYG
jgi:hypothetical protein